MPTKITAIIPARYSSTRFKGKVLADICGRPMIQHIFERVTKASVIDKVIIATDDSRIFETVRGFGGDVKMTSSTHRSGTDRISEVAKGLDSDIIINVQGDEPMIEPEMIDQVGSLLLNDRDVKMGTLCTRIANKEELRDPNVVKVVMDKSGYALYFSRFPIPFNRDNIPYIALPVPCYRHIGLFAYKREFLLKISQLPETPLEKVERLEQLRVLEHGYRIKVAETDSTTIGVDTEEDLEKVRSMMKVMG
ncbi:MAG: 3-deoxy-manno-octulosonate cytidylyltransferase [Nitrospinae bacterium]|nr:3-deoxy-manno-octulosonate cytidylyltransferase [Nitrospinota bacterium]